MTVSTIDYASIVDKYFTPETMSVHIKVATRVMSKIWKPGDWKSVYSDAYSSQEEIDNLVDGILSEVTQRPDSFLEIDRKLSKVVQLGHYRIVIVFPPLSDGLELTIVKPIKRLNIQDYHLDPKVTELLKNKSQWILVSWAPWSGKTTFAQALIDVYVDMQKIIKTVESPRDLMVPEEVVQYSFTHGTHDEVRDILLLSRPDFTIYDEVRNTNDFLLYKDLRLTGIGLVWVIHATNPIDSIQRFIGNIELGIIPQVIDTVIFIQWGEVKEIYTLKLTVKTPTGMMSDDLSRPVVEVKSYLTEELLYELYSYGEQIVVIPIADIPNAKQQSPSDLLAEEKVREFLNKALNCEYVVKVKNNEASIYVSDEDKWLVIGKWWEHIMSLEQWLWGMRLSVKTFDELHDDTTQMIQPQRQRSFSRRDDRKSSKSPNRENRRKGKNKFY